MSWTLHLYASISSSDQGVIYASPRSDNTQIYICLHIGTIYQPYRQAHDYTKNNNNCDQGKCSYPHNCSCSRTDRTCANYFSVLKVVYRIPLWKTVSYKPKKEKQCKSISIMLSIQLHHSSCVAYQTACYTVLFCCFIKCRNTAIIFWRKLYHKRHISISFLREYQINSSQYMLM